MLLQVFSFKLRGAYNKMANLTPEQRERGVITSSAGNHAQGVSLAASRLVRPCVLTHAGAPFAMSFDPGKMCKIGTLYLKDYLALTWLSS